MKKLIILLILLVSITVFSQEGKSKKRIEKIRESGKSAYYLTNETLKLNKFMKSHDKFLKTMRNQLDNYYKSKSILLLKTFKKQNYVEKI